jgi:hypothetical protein
MTRGPVSEQAIEWALPLAHQRGSVYFFRKDRECPCDLQIVNGREVVFVRVRRTRCLHRPVPDLEADCHEHVLRLRAVPVSPQVYRELWICSRRGTWRFFRITETGIEEIRGPLPATSSGTVAA